MSGDLDLLESVMSTIKERLPNVLVRGFEVEVAYHSRMSLLSEFGSVSLIVDRSHAENWRHLP